MERFPDSVGRPFLGGVKGQDDPDRLGSHDACQSRLQVRRRTTLVRRLARNRSPNTRAASLVETRPAEGPAATVMTVANKVIRAKTIIHPSIGESPFRDGRAGNPCQMLSTCNANANYTF